ncbi:sensor histidine kinase [Nocardia arthritidis]|uniref:sensor histidine kinase n=1 Tax=Nocardia arthritidis TaxID=228602 RepID=UPI0007A4078C|nr:histidine kinase [Nocardia arthritidis]
MLTYYRLFHSGQDELGFSVLVVGGRGARPGSVGDVRDQCEMRLSRRWRVLLVVCSLTTLLPVALFVPPTAAERIAVIGLVVCQAAAFWWLDRRPVFVTIVSLFMGASLELLHVRVGPGIALIVLTTFSWLRPARTSLWGLAAAVLFFALASGTTGQWLHALLWSGAALLAWSWGALGRARSAQRDSEARHLVQQERARITRELHDVLAHTVSLMVLQAAAANDVFDTHPDKAREAVAALESVGRQALGEVRRLLEVIDREPTVPSPGLKDLDRLVESMSLAGIEVVVNRHGTDDTAVAPRVTETAYRIVQESLTNVLRHARADRAEVDVRIAAGQLTVAITDNGGGSRLDHGSGRGLDGMRRRATELGGRFEAGPSTAGGFRVAAWLPVQPSWPMPSPADR